MSTNATLDYTSSWVPPPDFKRKGILIMDTCPVTALGMTCVLREFCKINYVQSLACIPKSIANEQPALLIMEICGETESVLDGLRLLACLRVKAMKIVICTDFRDPIVLELLVSSQVNGIVLKNEPALALEQCLFDVQAGERQWLSPKTKIFLKNTPQKKTLTTCELDILAYLFSGLSVSRVAQMLHRDIRTVSMHKRNAMAKLGFQNDSELFAHGAWMAKVGPAPSF